MGATSHSFPEPTSSLSSKGGRNSGSKWLKIGEITFLALGFLPQFFGSSCMGLEKIAPLDLAIFKIVEGRNKDDKIHQIWLINRWITNVNSAVSLAEKNIKSTKIHGS